MRRPQRRNPRYARRWKMTMPASSDPATWNVTKKIAQPSQLYLDAGYDSRRVLELVARAGLPVHQVPVNGMPGAWPVLNTRHRTLIGLPEIACWLGRLASVAGKDGAG